MCRAAATKSLVVQSQARLRSRLTTFQSQIQRRIKVHAAAAVPVIIFLVNVIISSQHHLHIVIGLMGPNWLCICDVSQRTINQSRIHWIRSSLYLYSTIWNCLCVNRNGIIHNKIYILLHIVPSKTSNFHAMIVR